MENEAFVEKDSEKEKPEIPPIGAIREEKPEIPPMGAIREEKPEIPPIGAVREEKPEILPIGAIREELAREEARYGFRRTVRNIAVALLVAAAIATLIATRMLGLIRVNGNSMDPTLADNEIIIIRQTKEFERGDIIGFYYGGRILLKRVIACEGDLVEIDGDGTVSVNGEVLDEPYLKEKNLGKCDVEFPYEVPEEMTFVLGDNRTISIDSRIKSIGCVDRDQIVGKAVFRAWPAERMEILR